MNSIVEFNAPETSWVGKGVLAKLPELVLRYGAAKVLLVTDSFFFRSGLVTRICGMLEEVGVSAEVFSGVQPDPSLENVMEGLGLLRSSQAGLLIAVGGGSPIDAAKAISILATNNLPLQDYMGYHRIKANGIPLIAIPTTAGTGSEATKVAVITDTQRGVKMMMFDRHLMPAACIVDPELSTSMPKPLTAHVGVDTLTHGIEAYVSRKSNPLSDPLALSCISLVSEHLMNAWEHPLDGEAREGMAVAAYQGGLAFTNSSVCLVHGMSRPLGALFHLAHGFSNAMLLPVITSYSIPGAEAKYAKVARTMRFAEAGDQDGEAAMKLVAGLEKLNLALGIPKLGTCGLIEKAEFEAVLEKMAQDALDSGSPQNNPMIPSKADIVALYKLAW